MKKVKMAVIKQAKPKNYLPNFRVKGMEQKLFGFFKEYLSYYYFEGNYCFFL